MTAEGNVATTRDNISRCYIAVSIERDVTPSAATSRVQSAGTGVDRTSIAKLADLACLDSASVDVACTDVAFSIKGDFASVSQEARGCNSTRGDRVCPI